MWLHYFFSATKTHPCFSGRALLQKKASEKPVSVVSFKARLNNDSQPKGNIRTKWKIRD